MCTKYLFEFTNADPEGREGIDRDIAVAILAAEFLHGRPRVRLGVKQYAVEDDGASATVEVGGKVGEDALCIMIGFFEARCGPTGYSVLRNPGR